MTTRETESVAACWDCFSILVCKKKSKKNLVTFVRQITREDLWWDVSEERQLPNGYLCMLYLTVLQSPTLPDPPFLHAEWGTDPLHCFNLSEIMRHKSSSKNWRHDFLLWSTSRWSLLHLLNRPENKESISVSLAKWFLYTVL